MPHYASCFLYFGYASYNPVTPNTTTHHILHYFQALVLFWPFKQHAAGCCSSSWLLLFLYLFHTATNMQWHSKFHTPVGCCCCFIYSFRKRVVAVVFRYSFWKRHTTRGPRMQHSAHCFSLPQLCSEIFVMSCAPCPHHSLIVVFICSGDNKTSGQEAANISKQLSLL